MVLRKGGWSNPDSIEYFLNYVEKIIEEFGNDVKYWLTLNEPLGFIFNSYVVSNWAPGKNLLT